VCPYATPSMSLAVLTWWHLLVYVSRFDSTFFLRFLNWLPKGGSNVINCSGTHTPVPPPERCTARYATLLAMQHDSCTCARPKRHLPSYNPRPVEMSMQQVNP
jgi:hypothetical protein